MGKNRPIAIALRFASIVLAATLLALSSLSFAHEVRPASLEIRQTGEHRYEVTFKQPTMQEKWLALAPEFPADCVHLASPPLIAAQSSIAERVTLQCKQPIEDRALRIANLDRTLTDVFVQFVPLEGGVLTGLVKPGEGDFVLLKSVAPRRYLGLGFTHILDGIDHVAFVILLTLLIGSRAMLVWAVSMFTIAHSITLGLATLGFLGLPSRPVEMLIALSVVLMAAEVVRRIRAGDLTVPKTILIVSFVFGLIHGLGFAGALSELGLPRDAKLSALVLFNLGVELGQLAVVAAVLAILAGLRRFWAAAEQPAKLAAAYAAGTFGFVAVIQRMAF